MQAHGFRVFFTPLPEVLFTFPSRYSCAIGLPVVFSLAGWSPRIPAGFLVSCGTQVAARSDFAFRLRGCHPLWPAFPRRSATLSLRFLAAPTTPAGASPRPRFGLLRFRSPLLAESFVYFLFLRVLRCFSSPRWPHFKWCPCGRVPPFGHPRITPYLPVPAVFRSLSRPSSPPGALGIPHAPLFAFLVSYFRAPPVFTPARRSRLVSLLLFACTPCQ